MVENTTGSLSKIEICSKCGSNHTHLVGKTIYCSYCDTSFDGHLLEIEKNYTNEIPDENGYYWVTRDGLGYWVLARVIRDNITIKEDDPFVIILFIGEHYRLNEFCKMGNMPFWKGPIKNPDENQSHPK